MSVKSKKFIEKETIKEIVNSTTGEGTKANTGMKILIERAYNKSEQLGKSEHQCEYDAIKEVQRLIEKG
jgi:hypothetical protein